MLSDFAEYLIATGRVARDRISAMARSEWLLREPIGRLAMMHGLLEPADIDAVLRHQTADERRFGELAVSMGILSSTQLEILARGQALRACLELVEDLALADEMEYQAGMEAISEYMVSHDFANDAALAVGNAA